MLAALCSLLAISALGQDLAPRTIQYRDLPAGIARRFEAKTFDVRIQATARMRT